MSSRVESFGMIAGEAMANGAICISADNPCLPEIFDNAAFYYSPGNPEDLCKRITEVITLQPHERKKISKMTIARSKVFSWDTCAKKTIDCLMDATAS